MTVELERMHFHTFERYEREGVDPFLAAARHYLLGEQTIPVSKPNKLDGFPEVTCTFANALLQQFVDDSACLRKPYDVTMRYGFRGYSTGRKNGIFYLRDGHDHGLFTATEALLTDERNQQQVCEDLDISKEGLDALRKVKIVWHEPSGTRVVGVYNTSNDKMIFLGLGQY